MIKYTLWPKSTSGWSNFVGSFYNRFMYWLARKSAKNMAMSHNKAIYGLEMYNQVHVMTSTEKKDIDKAMPKGNKMNIASTLYHMEFFYLPENVRKKYT